MNDNLKQAFPLILASFREQTTIIPEKSIETINQVLAFIKENTLISLTKKCTLENRLPRSELPALLQTNLSDLEITDQFFNDVVEIISNNELFFSQALLHDSTHYAIKDLFLTSLAKHPDVMKQLLSQLIDEKSLFQKLLTECPPETTQLLSSHLIKHLEITKKLFAQIINDRSVIQSCCEAIDLSYNLSAASLLLPILAEHPGVMQEWLLTQKPYTAYNNERLEEISYHGWENNFEAILLRGVIETKKQLLDILINKLPALLGELLFTPQKKRQKIHEDTIEHYTSAESLLLRNYDPELKQLLFENLAVLPQLFYQLLRIQDEQETTLFQDMLTQEGEGEGKKIEHDTLQQALTILAKDQSEFLHQLTACNDYGLNALHHAVINRKHQVIELLCKALSQKIELVPQIIAVVVNNGINSALDPQLFLNNLKEIQNCIQVFIIRNSQEQIECAMLNLFFIKDCSGNSIFANAIKNNNVDLISHCLKDTDNRDPLISLANLKDLEDIKDSLHSQLLKNTNITLWLEQKLAADQWQDHLLATDEAGNSAIHWLVYLNDQSKLQQLLNHVHLKDSAFLQQLLTITNKKGETATGWANHLARSEIISLLEKYPTFIKDKAIRPSMLANQLAAMPPQNSEAVRAPVAPCSVDKGPAVNNHNLSNNPHST